MPASFPEKARPIAPVKKLQSSSAAAIASGIITDAGPQFWKKTLNSGKVTPPLKTTLFEGVEIIFRPQFFPPPRQYVACTFLQKS